MTNYSPSYRSSKALIIGINSYVDDKFPKLGNAEKDAVDFQKLLSTLEPMISTNLLAGNLATRESILRELYGFRDSNREDRLLFYFAGHGFFTTDHTGKEYGHIAAYDTDSDMEFTAISLQEILELRLYTEAKHIGFIFDSCFSGQALGLTTRGTSVAHNKYLERRAYQVITAGAGDQTVSDVNSLTQLMIKGFNEGKAENEGMVTFSSLGLFLKEHMASKTAVYQIPQFGHIGGSQGGEIVLRSSETYTLMGTQPRIEKTKEKIEISPTQYTAEVDSSGRIDDLENPTTVTFFAGLHFSLLIPPNEKSTAIRMISKYYPKWGMLKCRVYLYTLLIEFVIEENIEKMEKVNIDQEYNGYGPYIKGLLIESLREKGKKVKKEQIEIRALQKSSEASAIASKVYRGEIRPDWIVTAEQILPEEMTGEWD